MNYFKFKELLNSLNKNTLYHFIVLNGGIPYKGSRQFVLEMAYNYCWTYQNEDKFLALQKMLNSDIFESKIKPVKNAIYTGMVNGNYFNYTINPAINGVINVTGTVTYAAPVNYFAVDFTINQPMLAGVINQ